MDRNHKTRFRLISPLPCDVVFPSIKYHLKIAQVAVSGAWQCQAESSVGFYLCAQHRSEELLRRELYDEGIEISEATILHVIFSRLAKEGLASIVPEPG